MLVDHGQNHAIVNDHGRWLAITVNLNPEVLNITADFEIDSD